MKKILVIEDNLEVRENLEEILELYGYEVVTAENGKVGVEIALKDQPDLIICDIMMPELDGFGVINILSKRQETASIPFVFLTAKSEKIDWRRGMNLGADDYITKPFYKDELLKVIELRLTKSEALKNSGQSTGDRWNSFINEARGYEQLKKLTIDKRSKVIPKKGIVFEEGDYPRNLYYIKSGKIKVYKTNEHGKEFIIHVLGEGAFFGYVNLITNTDYSESASALEPTEITLVPKEDFTQLLYVNQDVSAQFIRLLANNIAEKEQQLLNLAYDTVRKRVADALLKITEDHSSTASKEIKILRDDLARIVGTAKESVIRMLAEFKEDGYIQISNGKIQVTDRPALEKVPG